MANPVIEILKENNIKLMRVPANMTKLFQPLDLTVNSFAEACLQKKFTEWYSSSIFKQLEEGKLIEDIDNRVNAILKPLHAKWINERYDYIPAEESRKTRAAFITEAIEQGTKLLEPLNPFFDIDLLINEEKQTIVETLASQDNIDFFAT